ncbi:MAG: endonuclease domain-containing protein [Candidatus Zambryskibacteria bacterium]|nr:endonuclease domain-containing protein [Candidatus Zambryskibacteria bacterium]
MTRVHNIRKLSDRRKELRKNQTKTEEKLWWYLKDKRLGIKFRRQHSIGGYILDFICKEKKLIIEIDGRVHLKKDNKEYDKVRDKYFEELNYKVLRFTNDEVENGVKEIIDVIKRYL